MSEIQALERLLHHDIPLTGDMGLRVRAWDNHCLRLHVPLAPNVNHKSTMFGGSLYCAAVLAGWGWLHLRLGEDHGRARLQLQTQVLDGERCAVTFSGQYVVVAHTPPAPA
ncbi:hypothetical protein AO269_31985 [Pseudomonas putida]|nr:hypothetical protein AO269_31985 [Pseudomonas putida]